VDRAGSERLDERVAAEQGALAVQAGRQARVMDLVTGRMDGLELAARDDERLAKFERDGLLGREQPAVALEGGRGALDLSIDRFAVVARGPADLSNARREIGRFALELLEDRPGAYTVAPASRSNGTWPMWSLWGCVTMTASTSVGSYPFAANSSRIVASAGASGSPVSIRVSAGSSSRYAAACFGGHSMSKSSRVTRVGAASGPLPSGLPSGFR